MSLALLRLPLIFGEILVRYSSQGARLSRSRFSFHTSLPPPRARSLARVISTRRLPAAGPAPPPPPPRCLAPSGEQRPARASRRRRTPWRSRSSSSSSSPVARGTSSAAEMDERARPRSLARLVGDGGVRRGEVAADGLSGVIPRARATSRRLARRASAGPRSPGSALLRSETRALSSTTRSRASASARARAVSLFASTSSTRRSRARLDERRALRGEVVDDDALRSNRLLRRLELAEEVKDERGRALPRRRRRRRRAVPGAAGFPRALREGVRERAARSPRGGGAGTALLLQRGEERRDVANHRAPAHAFGPHQRLRTEVARAPQVAKRPERRRGLRGRKEAAEVSASGGEATGTSRRARAEKKRTGEETNNADRVAHRSLHAVEPSARPGVRPGRGRVARRHPARAPAPETGRRAVEDLRREPSARPTTDFVGDDDGDW